MNGHNLVRLPDAAKAIDISPKTLRRRIADGTVTGYRLGPRLLFVDIDDLTEAMTQGTKS